MNERKLYIYCTRIERGIFLTKKPKRLKMSQLLQIEAAFLRNDAVSQALRLNEVRSLQRVDANAKKKRFDTSLALSKHVAAAFQWFKSAEGQALFREEGISWTADDFASKVYGWQKSYLYKIVKVAGLPDEVIGQYCAACDAEGAGASRSVEDLLKFSRSSGQEGEGSGQEGEGSGQPSRPEVVLSVKFAHPDGEVKFKVDSAGQVHGSVLPSQVADLIQFLNQLA